MRIRRIRQENGSAKPRTGQGVQEEAVEEIADPVDLRADRRNQGPWLPRRGRRRSRSTDRRRGRSAGGSRRRTASPCSKARMSRKTKRTSSLRLRPHGLRRRRLDASVEDPAARRASIRRPSGIPIPEGGLNLKLAIARVPLAALASLRCRRLRQRQRCDHRWQRHRRQTRSAADQAGFVKQGNAICAKGKAATQKFEKFAKKNVIETARRPTEGPAGGSRSKTILIPAIATQVEAIEAL